MVHLTAKLRALYRALHREITLQSQPAPHHALSIPRNKEFHNHLRRVFSAPQKNPSRSLAEGEDILLYLRSQCTYMTLLERYNPSVGFEQDEKVRRTARRVGLELPDDLRSRIEEEEEKDTVKRAS